MGRCTCTHKTRCKKFIFLFPGCFPEGKKEERKGGKEGREGGREGGGRKWRLHVRIRNDVLSENDPFQAQCPIRESISVHF